MSGLVPDADLLEQLVARGWTLELTAEAEGTAVTLWPPTKNARPEVRPSAGPPPDRKTAPPRRAPSRQGTDTIVPPGSTCPVCGVAVRKGRPGPPHKENSRYCRARAKAKGGAAPDQELA